MKSSSSDIIAMLVIIRCSDEWLRRLDVELILGFCDACLEVSMKIGLMVVRLVA